MEVSSFWYNTQFTLARAPLVLRLKFLERAILTPFIDVLFETDQYLVKTANQPEELAQVLRLRFEVFFREFSTQKVSTLFPYDVDIHDFVYDHLIVKDKSSGEVVACYRLNLSTQEKKVKRFYTDSEFCLDDLMNLPGNKLELGRACVHRNYRRGTVIGMLWKGLIDYARKSKTRYLFGCSSLNRKDFSHLSEIHSWLKNNGSYIEDIEVTVRPGYELPFSIPQASDDVVSTRPVNSLLHMYLMAGAKVGKNFAYDGEMDCVDILTLLDLDKMPASFERRFT